MTTKLALNPAEAADLARLAELTGARPTALAHEAFRAGLYRVSLDAAVRVFQTGGVTTGELAERFDVPRVDLLHELERRGIPLMAAQVEDLAPERLHELIDLFPIGDDERHEAHNRLATALDRLKSHPPDGDRAAA